MTRRAYTSTHAAKEPWLPVLRELVRTYQAFSTCSGRHVGSLGLTSAQFDVVSTLGNTSGMTFKELGEHTLITKGALTGIIDRMEEKGLVRRMALQDDRRSILAQLTPKGEALFEEVFPAHIRYLRSRFTRLTESERKDLVRLLKKLKDTM